MNQIARKLLDLGRDDWVSLAELESYVREFSPATSDHELVERDLETIAALVEGGFVEIGSVTEAEGFTPWNETLSDALEKIRYERLNSNDWAWACWFANTELGDRIVREGRSGDAPRAKAPSPSDQNMEADALGEVE